MKTTRKAYDYEAELINTNSLETRIAQIKTVENVSNSINNIAITEIFEIDGKTCKKSTIAEYADNDTSKGTIEERLTVLGFKQLQNELVFDFKSGNDTFVSIKALVGSGATTQSSYKQGKAVQLCFSTVEDVTHTVTEKSSFFNIIFTQETVLTATNVIPEEFRPTTKVGKAFYMRTTIQTEGTGYVADLGSSFNQPEIESTVILALPLYLTIDVDGTVQLENAMRITPTLTCNGADVSSFTQSATVLIGFDNLLLTFLQN